MSQETIPDNFIGTYKLERSENFDEYLTASGVNWLLRKVISVVTIVKEWGRGAGEGEFTLTTKTPKKTFTWTFKLGQSFETEGFDGKQHKITMRLGPSGSVLEEHIRVEEKSGTVETYKYSMDGDYLLLEMSAKDVHCKRYLKKQ